MSVQSTIRDELQQAILEATFSNQQLKTMLAYVMDNMTVKQMTELLATVDVSLE
jgi:hypothetical protein